MNKSLVLLLVVALLGAVGCAAVESESSVAIASAVSVTVVKVTESSE